MRILPTRAELRGRLKWVLILVVAVIAIKGAWVWAFATDGARLLAGEERGDLMARRAWLVKRVLDERAGVADMPEGIGQRFRGEWALGTYSMLAASLTNLAHIYPDTRAETVGLMTRLMDLGLRPELRGFDTEAWGHDALETLATDEAHAAYLGHLAFMLGAYRFAGGDGRHDERLRAIATALARRMEKAPAHTLESYPGERYTMDNAVVMAALRNADKVAGTRTGPVVDAWLADVRARHLDPVTGLLCFEVGAQGDRQQGSRGSGAGWNSFYLPFVDRPFADAQFARVKELLIAKRLGFTGVLEFPPGVTGVGDVDSGPLVLGLSMSGSGFAVAGARHTRDAPLLSELLFTAEFVGSSVQWNGRRSYLLAPLVGESIMLAMKSAVVWELAPAR